MSGLRRRWHWAGRSGAWTGWVAVPFFGVCLLVAIIQVVTAARTFLKLDRRGFAMVQWGGRRHEVSWSDIESFWVANLIWTKVIAVRYSPSYQKAREARSVVRRLTRAQGVGDSTASSRINTPIALRRSARP
jgi:hypothetical protein